METTEFPRTTWGLRKRGVGRRSRWEGEGGGFGRRSRWEGEGQGDGRWGIKRWDMARGDGGNRAGRAEGSRYTVISPSFISK